MFQHQGAIFRESKVQRFASAKKQSWYYNNKMLKWDSLKIMKLLISELM